MSGKSPDQKLFSSERIRHAAELKEKRPPTKGGKTKQKFWKFLFNTHQPEPENKNQIQDLL
jgi:hypothetical protein